MTRLDRFKVALVGGISFVSTSAILRSRHAMTTSIEVLAGIAVALAIYARIDSPGLRHHLRVCGWRCERCLRVQQLRFERRRQEAMKRTGTIGLERAIEERARRIGG